ncbi:MAG: DUF1217 domain-containing protein [Rhizobiaceae bacterium]|nr:DUF1217 domain-containing protein [Hyphomicrobiales bacterium]NRB30544.1 DUF1217 domain-containing protein [Rhizobiaceae bacterium]
MLSTLTSYQLAVRDLPRSLEVVQSDGLVQRETEYYLENIGKVKSIEEFMDDDRLFRYAMKAHGLEEMNYAKALVTKVFEGGRDDSDAFVNRMADGRYRDLAETFDFNRYGSATTSFDRAQQGVVDKYLRQQLEENAGATNEGVRLALYFERKAPGLTTTEEILADSALSAVVRQTLQIPQETAFLDIDKQVEMLDERLDVSTFSDPEELSDFITRFVAIYDATNGVADPALNLFNQGTAYGVSTDMLLTIQSLR